MAKKPVKVFSCTECGSQSPKWIGRCPDCGAWNTFIEESSGGEADSRRLSDDSVSTPIAAIDLDEAPRLASGLSAFDRVLGGGLVPGGVVLVGGEPGIGKSTLLLHVADRFPTAGVVLYVSGEESPRQIAMRARRLGTSSERVHLYAETSIERIVGEIDRLGPAAVVIDSIQTVHTARNPGAAGSVGQVRDAAGMLLVEAKRRSIPLVLIGHVTKDGSIAGPKTLEHIVDTVLYFEGDRLRQVRIVRAVKNRFGPVNELALYEMHDDGLREVENPSRALISERSDAAGSAIVAAIEGTRPLLVEIQALVTPTHFPSPRRMATGLDTNRLLLLIAVLEKRGGPSFANHDVFVNVAGGLELDEPAADLGVIAALASSHRNVAIPHDVAVFGEVGLLGEVRAVSQPEARAREAAALGFSRIVTASSNVSAVPDRIHAQGVRTVDGFLDALALRR